MQPTTADVLARYVKARAQLRSIDEQQRVFNTHVVPALGTVPVEGLRRSQIAMALDTVAEKAGPVMASRTLAYLRAALNWYAARTDDWQPPLVRGMTRAWPNCGPRLRVLSDDELRRVWQATGDGAAFWRLVRVLLLTGQRRTEVAAMEWSELTQTEDGWLWTLPAARFKSAVPHMVPLGAAVMRELPARQRGPFVFSTTDGRRPFSGYSKALARLHRVSHTEGWRLHDLRRTMRTRLAGMGVAEVVAETIIGHAPGKLARIYVQHRFLGEMRAALDGWHATFARTVSPE